MQIGTNGHKYKWVENWARIPETPSGQENGRTHAAAVAANGDILVFNQAQPAVLRFGWRGKLLSAWGDRFAGAHGMTLVQDGERESLWLTDQFSGEVVRCSMSGVTEQTLRKPDHPAYQGGKSFAPTWVAVNEIRFGGNGDIWVADGYGASLIHRYNKDGAYLASISGGEGAAGLFACPHGIRFDYRSGKPELYITDRSNHRVQVYDADGRYLRHFGSDFLTSPCMFEVWGDYLLIPELFGRLAILDHRDNLIGYLGEQPGIENKPGWPNLPKEQIVEGKFNSPHGMACDQAGNLYIVEWIIGGRITKLERLGPPIS